jgi:hypothetical protein
MTKVRAGVDGLEGNALRLGYEITYGKGKTKKALLDIFVPMSDQTVADSELDSQTRILRRSELLELIEALREWQESGGYISQ